jgi:hypothetical protein
MAQSLEITITDKQLTDKYCITLFATGFTGIVRIVRVHYSKDKPPRSVIHLYYKGGEDHTCATTSLELIVNKKEPITINIPKSFLEATAICVDLYEHDDAIHDCYKRRYASCTITACDTPFMLLDTATNINDKKQCCVIHSFPNLCDELSIQLDKLLEEHAASLCPMMQRIFKQPNKTAIQRMSEYFEKMIEEYKVLYEPDSNSRVMFALPEINNQFFSPLYINNRLFSKVFVFNFVDRIIIPFYCKGTRAAFEKLFGDKCNTTEERIEAIRKWVHTYFKYSPDHHHDIATNVYSSGFIQDTLNCKDMAITVYQLITLAQSLGLFDNDDIQAYLVACIVMTGIMHVPHMVLAYNRRGEHEYKIVDATCNGQQQMMITSIFSETDSSWVVHKDTRQLESNTTEKDIYGVPHHEFIQGNFRTISKYYNNNTSKTSMLLSTPFHLALEELAMSQESPCLAINEKFPS